MIFDKVSLRDSNESIASSRPECKGGIRLRDTAPGFYNGMYKTAEARKLHDSNFAFVMTQLSKVHEVTYEPITNYTYAKDVPIVVGGGMVDFVDYFSVDWAGQPTEDQNVTGNNVNIIPRVNAKLSHNAVEVYNFEIAYDIKFIEIDKLNKLNFTKSLEAIYTDAIMVGWDSFCDKLAYEGRNGNDGLLNNANVVTTSMPIGTLNPTKKGLAAMTDSEIVGLFNGILSYYLLNSNMNIKMLPDRFLLPVTDAAQLSSRYSALFTATLREFLMNHNVGIDEAAAAGEADYKIRLAGRARLENAGTLGGGRIVAYKFDKKFVRMDIPYPIQNYFTGPNIDRACYTTYFVGQASRIQLMYNDSASNIGPVTYWDLSTEKATLSFGANTGTGTQAAMTTYKGGTITLPATTDFTGPVGNTVFKGWTATVVTPGVDPTDKLITSIKLTGITATVYAAWMNS